MVRDMLSIVKLGSVIFAGLVLNNYFGARQVHFVLNEYFAFMSSIVIFLAMTLFYTYWAFVVVKKTGEHLRERIEIVESLLFVAAFIAIIALTGGSESKAKVAFLFIIISATIQRGLRFGMLIAGIASASLLIIDVSTEANNTVNLRFEDDIALISLFFAVAWALGYYVRVNGEYVEKLLNMINLDGLTELFNHRSFYVELSERFANFKEQGTPLALVLIDLDYFKQYNDLFGHQRGDRVLQEIGAVLKALSDENVTVYRYGGDEFSLLLTGMDNESVAAFGEKLRQTLQDMHFPGEESLSAQKLTASIGIAACNPTTQSSKELMKCADDALYKAKFNNRNRVEFYSSVLESLKGDIEREQGYLIPSIKILVSIINAKDMYTYGHMEKVVLYAKLIAEELKLSAQEKRKLILGAYVHDVGKLNISEQILVKQTPLTDEEWQVLRRHPEDGEKIIRPIPRLEEVADIVLYHHERFDGKGYPEGLQGENIPYLARVMSVIDCFDAMTTDRPYKEKLTVDEAVAELNRNAGTQFDPQIVTAFLRVISAYKPHIETMPPNAEFTLNPNGLKHVVNPPKPTPN
jgi:diguanylate cyclase (GGDEF)-like protein